MSNKEQCCEKCDGNFDGKGCTMDNHCPCHQEQSVGVEEGWVTRFDKSFGFEQNGDAYFTVGYVENGVKQFIQHEITQAEARGAEKMREKCIKIIGSHESPHTPSNCRLCKILALTKDTPAEG